MIRQKLSFIPALVLSLTPLALQAQVSLTTVGTAYTQDFNTLANTGSSSTLPTGWLLNESGTSAANDGKYTAGTGSGTAGDTYSFGSTGSTDRAFGTLLSGTLTPTIGACFVNNTGATLVSLAIAYTGEQWRLGQSGRGSDHLDFSYQVGATDITSGTWTTVAGLQFLSPINVGTVGALDGNAAANRTAVSSTITGISIANGQNVCIRWTDFNVTGSDDGLGVDDFSLTPQAATSTNPTATGSSSPNPVLAGGTVTLTANVTPGSTPPSTGIVVSCDLTALGGSATSSLPNTTGNTYSAAFPVSALATPQGYSLPCTVSDDLPRSSTFNIAVTVVPATSLNFTPLTLTNATEGAAYSQVLTVNNATSCTFGATGTLPAGIQLNSTGTTNTATLAGVPTVSGTSSFSVNATCTNGSISQAYSLTVNFACESGTKTSTPIHSVQGSGATSPLNGQIVELEGIVVGSFQASTQLKGFYLQEPDSTWDSDPLTSEGIFIFDNLIGASVNIGDRVRVRGTIDEFASSGSFIGSTVSSSLTEMGTVTNKLVCSTGNSFTRTNVTLPVTAVSDFERYEGMAVQISQQLTVTGNFGLGTFDQLDLAPSVLYTPTENPDRNTWNTQASLIPRSIIALDDASTLANANLFPTVYPAGGLSATNTLRVGSLVNYDSNSHTNAPLVGVLDDRFGEYRIQPTAPVTFFDANPRPDIAPILTGVGGRFRAVSANVLNFFVALNGRGASTQAEFDHQKTKVIEELSGMDADVYGLSEVQNAVSGSTGGAPYTNAALQSLVDGLNCKKAGQIATCANPPATPYAMIDTLPLGALNGTDAIRSAIIYRPDRLTPVGGPAIYSQNDSNRPTLAQTFQPATGAKASSQTFTFVVNHYRSKGSACGGASDDPLQGNCNGLRTNMATNVVNWLATNPTGDPAASRKQLLVGDYNAYYGEDPIQYFVMHGYSDLIFTIIGPTAYSYNFASQAGYLDHAIVNPAFNSLIKSVAEWHNNSDEPAVLEALNSSTKNAGAVVAYFGADPYAASDHDPIVIGFNTLAGDFNDDGVVDTADQALITGSLNKSVSQVDRRMDLDGDGKITLNDYRIWTTLYRAFIQ